MALPVPDQLVLIFVQLHVIAVIVDVIDVVTVGVEREASLLSVFVVLVTEEVLLERRPLVESTMKAVDRLLQIQVDPFVVQLPNDVQRLKVQPTGHRLAPDSLVVAVLEHTQAVRLGDQIDRVRQFELLAEQAVALFPVEHRTVRLVDVQRLRVEQRDERAHFRPLLVDRSQTV